MTKKKNPAQINPILTKAINKLIEEVMAEEPEPKAGERRGEAKYTLTDKVKVLDRALKHEAIRLKVQDDGEGDFFRNRKGADDNGDS